MAGNASTEKEKFSSVKEEDETSETNSSSSEEGEESSSSEEDLEDSWDSDYVSNDSSPSSSNRRRLGQAKATNEGISRGKEDEIAETSNSNREETARATIASMADRSGLRLNYPPWTDQWLNNTKSSIKEMTEEEFKQMEEVFNVHLNWLEMQERILTDYLNNTKWR